MKIPHQNTESVLSTKPHAKSSTYIYIYIFHFFYSKKIILPFSVFDTFYVREEDLNPKRPDVSVGNTMKCHLT